ETAQTAEQMSADVVRAASVIDEQAAGLREKVAAFVLQLRAGSGAPVADQGSRTAEQGGRAIDQGARAADYGLQVADQGARAANEGLQGADHSVRTGTHGARTAATSSISTQAPNGSWATPKALRA